MSMIDFTGKRGLILGVANQRSIAYAVARGLHELGAELVLTYGPDPKGRFEQFVKKLQQEWRVASILPLDLLSDEQITGVFSELDKVWPEGLDFVLHSSAFALREDLERDFSQTSRQGWLLAQEVSAYSVVPLACHAAPRMKQRGRGSLVCMSFIGSVLAVPHYNVMGPAKAALEASIRYLSREYGTDELRFNAVSAGALKTLSSSGIKKFGNMLRIAGEHSALGRNVSVEEIANSVIFLLSDKASGISGQTLYVDAGFNAMAN